MVESGILEYSRLSLRDINPLGVYTSQPAYHCCLVAKMTHQYYSQRTGSNPNLDGLPLGDITEMFSSLYGEMSEEGYFSEAFGYHCIDDGRVPGNVVNIDREILVTIRKRDLWPIYGRYVHYEEDDLLDMVEFLYQYVSKPIDGTMHSYGGCGMHWETFGKDAGKKVFREKVNRILMLYTRKFELSSSGEVLERPEVGFEKIFEADVPSKDRKVVDRISAATNQFRRHGATLDDRRSAVRDLADVLEYLRDDVKKLLTDKDEKVSSISQITLGYDTTMKNRKRTTTQRFG